MTAIQASGSVVLASCRSPDQVAAALARLRPQCTALGFQLVVARAGGWDDPPDLLAGAHVVPCPAESTIPELRGAGLSVATGEWVAMTEDNCVVAPGWLAAMADAMSGGGDVAGGSMGNALPDRAIDSGAFFAEYGFFGPFERDRGPAAAPLMTGANVAYRNTIQAAVARWANEGMWEDVIHGRLAQQQARFVLAPRARVDQNLHYGVGAFCRDRYEHGRDYARVASAGLGGGRRLVRVVGSGALPPVLAARIWRSSGRVSPGAFVRALPFTLIFLAAWAVGEAIGYSLGAD